ncbi:MAG: hypothetical protein H5T66_01020 [Chloroflexi bacterium]|nr:hypothetical protein [Chloroflexota bacterium]
MPAIAVLAWPHWRDIWRWRLLTGLLILGALLTYLYLPLRAWMGATWTFGQVGTWHGFWDMILDTKTGRIFAWPEGPSALLERFRLLITLWSEELPLPFMMIGLVSLLGKWASFRRERVAFTLGVIPYLVLGMLIWEGRISDALLAIQLPLIMFSIIGLSLGAATLGRYSRIGRFFASGVMLVTVGVVFLIHRPEVLAISRDPSAQEIVAQVRRIPFEEGEQVAALMAPWGREYWILAYEDTFHRAFPQVDLVDHNANFREITDQGQRLLVLEKAFYVFPPAWWEERLGGPIALDYVAPQVIQITPKTRIRQQDLSSALLDLGNGVAIISTEIARSPDVLELLVSWQAVQPIREDYSVGVHLLAHVPPGPQDILAQADRAHPIGGWYPTSQWDEREIVQDEYLLSIPEGSHPVAVRIGMYRILGAGQFANTPWLTIPLEQE